MYRLMFFTKSGGGGGSSRISSNILLVPFSLSVPSGTIMCMLVHLMVVHRPLFCFLYSL